MTNKLNKKTRITLFLGGIDGSNLLGDILYYDNDNFIIVSVFQIIEDQDISDMLFQYGVKNFLIDNIIELEIGNKFDENSIMVSCGFQRKIPLEILKKFKINPINIHIALLESYRLLKKQGNLIIASYVWKDKTILLKDNVHSHNFREFEIYGALEKHFSIEKSIRYEYPKGESHRL